MSCIVFITKTKKDEVDFLIADLGKLNVLPIEVKIQIQLHK